MKLDVMAFGAHPDDCELSMGGTLLVLKNLSYRVGVCDLSSGELGTYGSGSERKKELERASEILSLDVRLTLDFVDGNVRNTDENRKKVIQVIRKYRPTIVFSFVDDTRHPDHLNVGKLVKECSFLAGLKKLNSDFLPHRPAAFFRFPELIPWEKPDFVVDISDVWDKKLAVLRSFESQFTIGHEETEPPQTFLKSKEFWELIEAKARLAGSMIGVRYGEPFYSDRPLRILDPVAISSKEFI
ncbi:MAG: bacillithiol biosynthesis deacetylase BshB1 [Candidatus Aminicenantes bacterium]|nr:bacillithiol biosynthesis deacetylase BshB1 [Candidatus Aminicenantes bacterium]